MIKYPVFLLYWTECWYFCFAQYPNCSGTGFATTVHAEFKCMNGNCIPSFLSFCLSFFKYTWERVCQKRSTGFIYDYDQVQSHVCHICAIFCSSQAVGSGSWLTGVDFLQINSNMVILCNYIKPFSHVNSELDFLARGCLPLWTGSVAVVAESREENFLHAFYYVKENLTSDLLDMKYHNVIILLWPKMCFAMSPNSISSFLSHGWFRSVHEISRARGFDGQPENITPLASLCMKH